MTLVYDAECRALLKKACGNKGMGVVIFMDESGEVTTSLLGSNFRIIGLLEVAKSLLIEKITSVNED